MAAGTPRRQNAASKKRKFKSSTSSGPPSKAADIPSISTLHTLAKAKVDEWFRAASTSESYKRYVKEGREWVLRYSQQLGDSADSSEGSWDIKELASAFDVIGDVTPKALHAFVVYKCEVLENSYKTAEAIRSAFKHYFI
ncbi:hypothetical protein HWV62_40004 [Athelia sp. TMB]|nr:hypothetical protein HWV62_40004 [Athelia sp. TMB]